MRSDRDGAVGYVWAYKVDRAHTAAFRAAYGPDGEWVAFFRRSSGYLGTDLLEDRADATRFVTIDYFADEHVRGRLVAAHRDEYDELDRRWEAVTEEEVHLGAFEVHARR